MKAIWKSGLPNYLHKLLSQHILILNEKKKIIMTVPTLYQCLNYSKITW